MSDTIKLTTEGAARTINRRRLLRRALDTSFFAVAFWALEGISKPSPATAAVCNYYKPPGVYYCTPPTAGYCMNYSGSYCSGADCAGGCTTSGCGGYQDNANCWCTDISCNPDGYYICCDCNCSGASGPSCCVCAQFVPTGGCR